MIIRVWLGHLYKVHLHLIVSIFQSSRSFPTDHSICYSIRVSKIEQFDVQVTSRIPCQGSFQSLVQRRTAPLYLLFRQARSSSKESSEVSLRPPALNNL